MSQSFFPYWKLGMAHNSEYNTRTLLSSLLSFFFSCVQIGFVHPIDPLGNVFIIIFLLVKKQDQNGCFIFQYWTSKNCRLSWYKFASIWNLLASEIVRLVFLFSFPLRPIFPLRPLWPIRRRRVHDAPRVHVSNTPSTSQISSHALSSCCYRWGSMLRC